MAEGGEEVRFMVAFRVLLVLMLAALTGYTAVVATNHGLGLLPVFFGDIMQFAWPGQFNLDFLFMLILSAVWVAWRHRFSAPGLALAALALFGGALFLSVYLLVESFRSGGDARTLLLGQRAGA